MGEILFLAHRVPFPPDRGDRIRSHHLLKKLASLAPVHVGSLAENAQDRAGESALSALAASHHVAPRVKPLALAGLEAVLSGKPVSLTVFDSRALRAWVARTIAERPIEAIVVFSGQMGQYVPDEFAGRVIVDLCDVDSAKFRDYADAGQRVWLNRREARLLAREEERLAARADATLLISDDEAALLKARLDAETACKVRVIGNGVDAASFDPADIVPEPRIAGQAGPHFVFTGQMDYPPNEQAAEWTARRFLSLARAHFPAARFHVVGRAPSERVRALGAIQGVSVWGEVPDMRPFLAAATCVIAPLEIARGVQNKVLEAMAMARPVLLTPAAARGIEARNGEHWLVAEAEPGAMLDAARALLADAPMASRIGAAARRFVIERHGWPAMLAPIEELVGAGRLEARHAA